MLCGRIRLSRQGQNDKHATVKAFCVLGLFAFEAKICHTRGTLRLGTQEHQTWGTLRLGTKARQPRGTLHQGAKACHTRGVFSSGDQRRQNWHTLCLGTRGHISGHCASGAGPKRHQTWGTLRQGIKGARLEVLCVWGQKEATFGVLCI